MKSSRINILCVLDYYLPGFKGGGPIRTVANMRECLSADVDFSIFTRDRDLGSKYPFEKIPRNEWATTEHGLIYYAGPDLFNASGLSAAASGLCFDVLYLNSFFGFKSSISAYLKFRSRKNLTSILIAPRGEFSAGALSIKRWKKAAYLGFARMFGLYNDVHWHASTSQERDDILKQFPGSANRIFLAEDPVNLISNDQVGEIKTQKEPGNLKLVFISRISPMKNLAGLLKVLATVRANVIFDIYGPREDWEHWEYCRRLMDKLPNNISASYKRELEPEEVSGVFSRYDLFALPTLGENFGHVIFEALRVGTPVLVSDKTPWKSTATGSVSVAPLSDDLLWRNELELAAARNNEQQKTLRMSALSFARDYASKSNTGTENLEMFRKVSDARLL